MQFLSIVNFISFKEMFQNTQQLAEKGTYETVYHGTSVYAICYMADKESRGQYETNQGQINTVF